MGIHYNCPTCLIFVKKKNSTAHLLQVSCNSKPKNMVKTSTNVSVSAPSSPANRVSLNLPHQGYVLHAFLALNPEPAEFWPSSSLSQDQFDLISTFEIKYLNTY